MGNGVRIRSMAVAICASSWLISGAAQAHFRLLEPASWIEENGLGDPQKFAPCGTNESVTGTPTDAITTYTAGETISVKWTETIPHPGHFRIALARDRSELEDPDIAVDNFCNPTGEIDFTVAYPVLKDNLYPRASASGSGTMFSEEITLPADMTCEKCTLQVIQFMFQHAPHCIYYHCADIRIVAGDDTPSDAGMAGASGNAADGGVAGAGGGVAGSAGSAGAAGMSSEPAPPAGGGAGTAGTSAGEAGAPAGMPIDGDVPGMGAGSGASMNSGETASGCATTGTGGSLGSVGPAAVALLLVWRRRRGGRRSS